MHDNTHNLHVAAKALATGALPVLDNDEVMTFEDLTPLINAAAIELDLSDDLDDEQIDIFGQFATIVDRLRLRRAILTNTNDTTLVQQFRAAVTREARCEALAETLAEAFSIVREARLELRLTTEWVDGFGDDWDIRSVHVAVGSQRVVEVA